MNPAMKRYIDSMVMRGKCVFQMDADMILQGIDYQTADIGKYCYLKIDNGCSCQYGDIEVPLIGKRKRCILGVLQ
jgi:hypothetical protein